VLAAIALVAAAQHPGPVLGPPMLVAKGVQTVHWSPNAQALVYIHETAGGRAIGVYDVERDVAATVRPVSQDEVFESLEWLGSGTQALVVVRKGKAGAYDRLLATREDGRRCGARRTPAARLSDRPRDQVRIMFP
jgi:hypothetical protein